MHLEVESPGPAIPVLGVSQVVQNWRVQRKNTVMQPTVAFLRRSIFKLSLEDLQTGQVEEQYGESWLQNPFFPFFWDMLWVLIRDAITLERRNPEVDRDYEIYHRITLWVEILYQDKDYLTKGMLTMRKEMTVTLRDSDLLPILIPTNRAATKENVHYLMKCAMHTLLYYANKDHARNQYQMEYWKTYCQVLWHKSNQLVLTSVRVKKKEQTDYNSQAKHLFWWTRAPIVIEEKKFEFDEQVLSHLFITDSTNDLLKEFYNRTKNKDWESELTCHEEGSIALPIEEPPIDLPMEEPPMEPVPAAKYYLIPALPGFVVQVIGEDRTVIPLNQIPQGNSIADEPRSVIPKPGDRVTFIMPPRKEEPIPKPVIEPKSIIKKIYPPLFSITVTSLINQEFALGLANFWPGISFKQQWKAWINTLYADQRKPIPGKGSWTSSILFDFLKECINKPSQTLFYWVGEAEYYEQFGKNPGHKWFTSQFVSSKYPKFFLGTLNPNKNHFVLWVACPEQSCFFILDPFGTRNTPKNKGLELILAEIAKDVFQKTKKQIVWQNKTEEALKEQTRVNAIQKDVISCGYITTGFVINFLCSATPDSANGNFIPLFFQSWNPVNAIPKVTQSAEWKRILSFLHKYNPTVK